MDGGDPKGSGCRWVSREHFRDHEVVGCARRAGAEFHEDRLLLPDLRQDQHEDLWRRFFDGVPEDQYCVFVHYKTDRPLQYFESNKLKHCIPTKWADVSIVHAQNLLFAEALTEGCNKIVGLSHACIPLKSFEHVHTFLSKDDRGHFNIAPKEQCFPRCDRLLEHYGRRVIQKSSTWFILNRRLAELGTTYPPSKIDLEYGEIFCPDEHYFITRIYQNGLEGDIDQTSNLAEGATTFTNWGGHAVPICE